MIIYETPVPYINSISTFFKFRVKTQPLETSYLGTVIKQGYADEDSYVPFNIGFNITFFGNSYSQFYVNTNGLVLLYSEEGNL